MTMVKSHLQDASSVESGILADVNSIELEQGVAIDSMGESSEPFTFIWFAFQR